MPITKAFIDKLDTRLLNLAEKLSNMAEDAGESDEQQARAEALREVSDLLYEAKTYLVPWVEE